MLRSVFLKNFVNFEEKQFLDFNGAGPYIFIGENGAGKSCVLEGIRRCLNTKYSTSVSSSFDPKKLSYFICNFEIDKDEYIICGVVAKPETLPCESTALETTLSTNVAGNNCKVDANEKEHSKEADIYEKQYKEEKKESKISRLVDCTTPDSGSDSAFGKPPDASYGVKRENLAYYKFSLHHTKTRNDEPLSKYRLIKSTDDGTLHVYKASSVNKPGNDGSKKHFVDIVLQDEPDEGNRVENFLLSEFTQDNLLIDKIESAEEDHVDQLTGSVVFTLPLRSIGPLQWSESDRISPGKREENYIEAERRCEIIRYFLEVIKDEKQTKFDKDKEKKLFKTLTRSDDYQFELKKDGRIIVNREMFALLKTPEGILEAKAFSILMSGNNYKTIILEEPDRGMHPQFIERMMHLIKKSQCDKRVILTTHNTAFITPWSLSDCFVFRRRAKECCIISGKAIAMDTKKPDNEKIIMKRLRLLTFDHLSDILFAKRVLFCEGDSDYLFLTELKQQILSGNTKQLSIFDKNKLQLEESLVELTIIKLNGKSNAELCLNVSKIMKLDAIFLLDKETEGRREKFKDNPNVFFWKFGDIEDMVIDMCRDPCNDGLEAELNEQRVTVNKDKFQKTKSKSEKLFLRDDVEVKHIKAATRLLLEYCIPGSDLGAFIEFLYSGKKLEQDVLVNTMKI